MVRLILSLLLITAIPELFVNWSQGTGSDAIRVSVKEADTLKNQCLSSGLEVYYRFEVMLCRRRALWLDKCGEIRTRIHRLQFDPISETYRISLDRIGDKEPAQVTNVTDIDEALKVVSNIEAIPLATLGAPPGLEDNLDRRSKSYVGVRVLSSCRGDYSATLERISYFVSLGLIRTSGYDSGWIDFKLDS